MQVNALRRKAYLKVLIKQLNSIEKATKPEPCSLKWAAQVILKLYHKRLKIIAAKAVAQIKILALRVPTSERSVEIACGVGLVVFGALGSGAGFAGWIVD